jgi:hypothetical protein
MQGTILHIRVMKQQHPVSMDKTENHRSVRPAVLAWLTTLLHERISPWLLLGETEPGFIRLFIASSGMAVQIRSDPAVFSQSRSDLPCSRWNARDEGWDTPLDPCLPAPGASQLPSPLIEVTERGYVIHYDVLGLTYWMLSRQEEVGRTDLDEHDRFPAHASHAYGYGYLDRPVVDEWWAVLRQVVSRVWPGLRLVTPTFSVRVSHDVDTAGRYAFSSFSRLMRTMAGDLLRRRDPIRMLEAPLIWCQSKEKLHHRDPFNTFNWIMDVSDQYALTSAFYFICGRTDPNRDAPYSPRHPAIRKLMRRIHARGHEIGLHPSYNTFRNPDSIVAEARQLREVCEQEGIRQESWGGRMHYLRWDTPATLYGWERAGMTYDSTLSYAELPGFRCGTCLEYPAFDPVAGKALNLRIRPLIAMECTVMAPRYMNLGTGMPALDKFTELMDACRAVNGTFTLLWHNTLLQERPERFLYTSLLSNKPAAPPGLLQ